MKAAIVHRVGNNVSLFVCGKKPEMGDRYWEDGRPLVKPVKKCKQCFYR